MRSVIVATPIGTVRLLSVTPLVCVSLCCQICADAQIRANEQAFAGYEIKSTQQVRVGKDTITYQKISPPTVRPKWAVVSDLDAGKLQDLHSITPAKRQVFLSVTANVYGPVTELVWSAGEDGHVHRVLSNIDFSHFPASLSYSTEDADYSLMVFTFNYGGELGPWNSHDATTAVKIAQAKAQLQGKVGFDFVALSEPAGAEISSEEVDALEVMHSYYSVNRQQMIQAAAQRQIEAEEQARLLEAEAQKPKAITIKYWREDASLAVP